MPVVIWVDSPPCYLVPPSMRQIILKTEIKDGKAGSRWNFINL